MDSGRDRSLLPDKAILHRKAEVSRRDGGISDNSISVRTKVSLRLATADSIIFETRSNNHGGRRRYKKIEID